MSEAQKPVPIRFPIATILTVLLTMALVRGVEIIAPLFLPLLISLLIAVSLTPALQWLVNRKWPRGLALSFITLCLSVLAIVLFWAIVPSLYRQVFSFFENLPQFREDILKNLSPENPVHDVVAHTLQQNVLSPKADQIKQLFTAGNMVIGGFAEIFLVFIMAVYLLADGPRIIVWSSAFFEPATQDKIKQTGSEVAKIISAYVLGQFLTSALSFAFALICLLSLGVPNAVLLAALAGILDVLPVLGFFLAVIPAMLFAADVSLNTSWIVLGLYVFYHFLENHFIVPLVYGNKMRVSSFVVFFTLLAAGLLGGIEGAIVILPIVASYPIVERIWLRRYVRKEALIEHSID